jgi:uncharacterized membrane protein YtjA (UPF0391 family)
MQETASARAIRSRAAAGRQAAGKKVVMLYYALVFLVGGIIVGTVNWVGMAAMATQIAWVLFVIGIVLLVIHLVTGRTVRAS